MKFRTADYAHPPDRDRFTLSSVADIFTAPDDVQAKIRFEPRGKCLRHPIRCHGSR